MGSTTRLEPNKARQLPLTGLVLFVHVFRHLRELSSFAEVKSRDAMAGQNGPKLAKIVSESRISRGASRTFCTTYINFFVRHLPVFGLARSSSGVDFRVFM
jgi:hypothetical protein